MEARGTLSLADLRDRYDLRIVVRENRVGGMEVWIDNMVWFQYAWRDEVRVHAVYKTGQDVIDVLLSELRCCRHLVIKRPWYRRNVHIDMNRWKIER